MPGQAVQEASHCPPLPCQYPPAWYRAKINKARPQRLGSLICSTLHWEAGSEELRPFSWESSPPQPPGLSSSSSQTKGRGTHWPWEPHWGHTGKMCQPHKSRQLALHTRPGSAQKAGQFSERRQGLVITSMCLEEWVATANCPPRSP